MYIWQRKQWPNWRWDLQALGNLQVRVAHKQGRLLGKVEGLGFDLRNEAHLQTLTEDVVKSSSIEGEELPVDQVRSSIARQLGLFTSNEVPSTPAVDGVVEMLADAASNFAAPLTRKRLLNWHRQLFPEGVGLREFRIGKFRSDKGGSMQVVSGPIGREKVHYQAPPADQLIDSVKEFQAWFNASSTPPTLITVGVAHLWFVTLHPFDDGNGRIARAIADMALARSDQSVQRFYSMSAQIRDEREMYYQQLERTQGGDLDITEWLEWFLECLDRALDKSDETIENVLKKARFWQQLSGAALNERQHNMLTRLIDNFEGKLTTSKWAKISHCSQDTATRDIKHLIEIGVLTKDAGGGRSTSYSLTVVVDRPGIAVP